MSEKISDLAAEISNLHSRIDEAVRERIYAAAAEISGVPIGALKNRLIARCSSGYCRCRTIRNIASGEDGL